MPTSHLDPGYLSFHNTTGRRPVDSRLFAKDARVAVIFCLGKSNIANEGDPTGLYVPTQGVYNFNLFDGRCYVARDPLLGTSLDRSNVATRVGDLLVRNLIYDRVLLVPASYGGTFIVDWIPGGRMFPRIAATARQLRRAGIEVTHVLWQQGEAEGAQANADGAQWARDFVSVTRGIRQLGIDAPIYVAQCTLCCNEPNEIIRAAQRSVVDSSQRVLAAPDFDTIGREHRWDGCHFSTSGLDMAAEMWLGALARSV